MKKLKKFLAGLLCAASLSTCFVPAVSADDEIRVLVNGAMLDFEGGKPQVIGTGTTMVPFRYIFEALGMTVSYHQGSDYFRVWAIDYKNDVRIDMYRDDTTLYKSKNSEFDAAAEDANKLLNVAQQIEMPEAPFIDASDRTLVPARAIAESLGASVDWEQDTKTVIINYDRVPYYGDFSAGDYPDTDIPSFYDVTGVRSKSVVIDPESTKYEYDFTKADLNKYLSKLDELGMATLMQGQDMRILESPTNRYIAIQLMTGSTMIISVMSNPEVYIAATSEPVPNYTYCTGRVCMDWTNDEEDDTHSYFYGKSERELQMYLNALSEEGYLQANYSVNENNGIVTYLYMKNDTYILIKAADTVIGIAMGDLGE